MAVVGGQSTRAKTVHAGMIALVTFLTAFSALFAAEGAALQTSVTARLTQDGNPTFAVSSFAVVPGTTVSLHWVGDATSLVQSGVHLRVTSTLPGFSSTSVVRWPLHTLPLPHWDGSGWFTTATAMSVTIPLTATPGTIYQFEVAACTAMHCVEPANSTTLHVPTSVTTWTMRPYRNDFSGVAAFPVPGHPFAAVFLASNNSIWSVGEGSHDVSEVPSNTTQKASVLSVPTGSGANAAFRKPFAWCSPSKCWPNAESALGESITTSNSWIWTTFGGWRIYANGQRDAGSDVDGTAAAVRGHPVANHSEVVGYDATTGRFCTYLVPGDNTQVAGITTIGTGPGTQVWFVASYGPKDEGTLDEFSPFSGGRACNGRHDGYEVLPETVVRLSWPRSGAQWPVQIAADPASPTLWISDFNPYPIDGTAWSGIERVDVSNVAHPTFMHRYTYPAVNASTDFGAKPWTVVAPPDSDYVYAIDNGDAELIRINKVTNQLQEISIPLTTDLENGFGLAVSSGRLYFTLANDYDKSQVQLGGPSTFGYLSLSSWPDDGPPANGVIYTGLAPITDGMWTDYRSIATGANGDVALTDGSAIVRLTPRQIGN
jgi:hypothetical protein